LRIFIQVSRPPASSQLPQRGAQVVKETVKVWGLSAEESLVQLDEEYRRLVSSSRHLMAARSTGFRRCAI